MYMRAVYANVWAKNAAINDSHNVKHTGQEISLMINDKSGFFILSKNRCCG